MIQNNLLLGLVSIYDKIEEVNQERRLAQVADKLSNGLPARVILETTIVQEDEVYKHSFDEMGRVVSMNDNYYVRFTESEGEEEAATIIKIEPEGVVNITRHGEQKTRMIFSDQEQTYTNYITPTGIMEMLIETNRLNISYTDHPFAGEIEVDYVIKLEGYLLGTYQIRLRFTT